MLTESTISFTALTPVWTGDAWGKSDRRTLETGILGSLRWWTEVLVRGMGVPTEDPTSSTHEYKPDEYEGDPVEKLFGFTGWKRRFTLRIEGGERHEFKRVYTLPIAGRPRPPSWQFRSSAWRGDMRISLVGARPETAAVLHGTLWACATLGALGAKSQHGCGIVRCDAPENPAFLDWLRGMHGAGKGGAANPDLPCLQNLFGFEYAAKEKRLEDLDTFWSRYYLREAFRPEPREPRQVQEAQMRVRHFVMGSRGDDRQGSKVCVSFPFDAGQEQRMRVWGWLPENADREPRLGLIRGTMTKHFQERRHLAEGADRIDAVLKGADAWKETR